MRLISPKDMSSGVAGVRTVTPFAFEHTFPLLPNGSFVDFQTLRR
jgi:hypothetical protein